MQTLKELKLHCYASYNYGYWTAYCLDLTLYAIGDTLAEARSKLETAITEYVESATVGPDAQFHDQLIPRHMTLMSWLKYYIHVVNTEHH